jgi:MFS family permease
LLSAFFAPAVGRAIDQRGGRGVLAISNLVLAGGLVLLASAHGLALLALAWAVLGIGMAMGLYEPAFATLTGLYGRAARGPITGITLIAGFASTVGWPLSAFLDSHYGWRETCLVWAALHILMGLPLNRLLIPPAPPPQRSKTEGEAAPAPRWAMPILALVFAATAFVTGAMAAHLPHLLEIAGASTTIAIAASALVGPAQVGARLIEFGALRVVHPLVSAGLSAVLHPIGAAVLALFGPCAVMAFAVLHGAGNGLLTIARGTVPLAVFGPVGYGMRTGLLGAPARATQALGPFLFGLLLDRMGVASVAISAALCCRPFWPCSSSRPARRPRWPSPEAEIGVLRPGSSAYTRAIVLAQMLTQLGAFAPPALLPGYSARWSLSATEAGWLVDIFFAAYVVMVPVLVALTDRMPARRVYMLGTGLTALSHLGFALLADGFGRRSSCGCWVGRYLYAGHQNDHRAVGRHRPIAGGVPDTRPALGSPAPHPSRSPA